MSREVLTMALEAIENIHNLLPTIGSKEAFVMVSKATTKIKEALAQQERPWVGLTDAEMESTCAETWSYDPHVIARAIEAKLKEKNT